MKYLSELFQGFIFQKASGGKEGVKLLKVCHKGTVLFFLFLFLFFFADKTKTLRELFCSTHNNFF